MSVAGFQVSPLNYLGIEHNSYKNKLYALAVSNPSEYFKLKEKVDSKVKQNVIKNLYKELSEFLSEGKSDGNRIISINGVNVAPSYPQQAINQIVLGVAKTLENCLDECIDIVLPLDFQKILHSRLVSQGNANLLGAASAA